ncbi:transposon-transfer assisting family protein [uncultured Dysosmobacter sp.]|uniref:transposon-transfer assisting family protein n=1 Tax=uncultured Dysosmobacter sp. TaxID=2591384 RepID=UPI0026053AA9|nr:transposon-transfer assisting family protein [uncultured Dysosmobacter sp.]
MVHFTVEEENLVCVYYKADRHRTMGRMTAALPDLGGDMRELAQRTVRKLEAMSDADFEDMRFLFTDE